MPGRALSEPLTRGLSEGRNERDDRWSDASDAVAMRDSSPSSCQPLEPGLSVVVVTYRNLSTIEACLDPLVGGPVVSQAIVLSNDSDRSMMQFLTERYGDAVSAVWQPDNPGFGRACNMGLSKVTTELTLLLNPDCSITEDDLRACVEELRRWPDVGVLSCRLVMADGSLDHACKRNIPTPSSALSYFLGRHGGPGDYTASELREFEIGEVGAVNGAFMLARTAALREVRGFDEAFWMYAEDLDLCLRLRQAGWRILYWPKVTAVHLKAASSGPIRSWRLNHAFHRSMLLFFRKHYSDAPRVQRALVGVAVYLRLVIVYGLGKVSRLRA